MESALVCNRSLIQDAMNMINKGVKIISEIYSLEFIKKLFVFFNVLQAMDVQAMNVGKECGCLIFCQFLVWCGVNCSFFELCLFPFNDECGAYGRLLVKWILLNWEM